VRMEAVELGGEEAVRAPPNAFWMPSRIELALLLLLLDSGTAKGAKVGECGGDCAEIKEVQAAMQVAVVKSLSGGWMDG
jgi:hypothetical protein